MATLQPNVLYSHMKRDLEKNACEPFNLVTNLTSYHLHFYVIKLEMCNNDYKNYLLLTIASITAIRQLAIKIWCYSEKAGEVVELSKFT